MKKKLFVFCLSLVAIFTFGQSRLVTPQFFGMHFTGISPSTSQWPAPEGCSTVRLWEATVNLGNNTYESVQWPKVNPGDGQYNWTQLDRVVALAESTGVDLVYTLAGGYSYATPAWVTKDANGMPNLTIWQTWVTAIATRYNGSNGHGRIKYWEVWNEPNNDCGGLSSDACGAKLFPYGQAVYNIVKVANSTNMVLSPSPQGNSAHVWLDSYFKAGGSAYTDIIAFHGYVNGEPEKIVALAQNVSNLRNAYPALTNKPIWDTEHSWGRATWPFGADEDQQAAWVARFLPLSISSGIDRSLWYMYSAWNWTPDANWGWLFSRTQFGTDNGFLRKPGIAYNQVYEWLNGANLYTCEKEGEVYSCRITRTGYEGLMVWSANSTAANPTATAAYTVPEEYNRYQTLDGTTVNITGGSSLTLTMKPILLEGSSQATSVPVPTGLVSGNITQTSFTLSWASLSDGGVTGYEVFKDGTSIGTTALTSISVTGLKAGTTYSMKVRAHDAVPNWSAKSTALNVTTLAPNTATSTTSWQSFPISTQTGTFTASFDAVPNAANINAVTGIQNGTATGYTSQACQIRFNSNGTIDARNGGTTQAATIVKYTAGTSYHFRLEINIPAHTYSIYVTPYGQSEITLGTNHAFRTDQASVTQLTGWSLNTTNSSHTVSNMKFTPSVTSTTSWQSFPISTQTGAFTASFDAVPNSANIDAMTGIQNGTATAYSSMACAVRFNSTGQIDARNGGAWSSATSVNCTAGTSYHFRLEINIPAHTYSIYVTPTGQSEITLGTNYAFRTEQANVAQLSGWSLIYTTGSSHTVSNMTIVADNIPPVAVAHNVTVHLDASGNGSTTAAEVDNGSSDASGSVSLVLSQTAFTCANVGANTVSLTVADVNGNVSTATAVVTVVDNIAPILTCPQPLASYDTDAGLCTKSLSFEAEASDNCEVESVKYYVDNVEIEFPHAFPFGQTIVEVIATDVNANSTTCTFTVNVNKVTTVTSVSVSPNPQQYSDKVTFTASVLPFNCGDAVDAANSVTFAIGTQTMCTANLINGIATCESALKENPSWPSNGQMSPGDHTVCAIFNSVDPEFIVNTATSTIHINCETASVAYNGGTYFSANPNNGDGTVSLSAFVVDSPDGNRGDIRNANLSFYNGTSPLGSSVTAGLIDQSKTYEGFATTDFNYTLSSQEQSSGGKIWEVWTSNTINNYYCGETDGYTTVTLAMPGSDFVTGGGHILMTNTSGQYPGLNGANKRMNFGLVMKWNKSGKNLQGNINVIYRGADGNNYQIKSNAFNSLAVTTVSEDTNTYKKATITTKANFKRLKPDGSFEDLGGNLTLIVTAWENQTVNTGQYDRIGVELSGASGTGIYFSSNWSNGNTQFTTLNGGKIQVQSTASVSGTSTKGAFIIDPILTEAKVNVFPNPFTDKLFFEFTSPTATRALLEIYSITGAKMATLFDAPVEAGRKNKAEYVPHLVSSQMVLYHLTMNGQTCVGKMVYNERR